MANNRNGSTNGSSRNGHMNGRHSGFVDTILLNNLNQRLVQNGTVNSLADPSSLSRTWMSSVEDPRRDINAECGWPPDGMPVSVDLYRELYDRHPIAARVVECEPKESWEVQPLVYEDEDASKVTDFEEDWDSLGQTLQPETSWYQDEAGSLVWEYLLRLDIAAGIGQFGVLLLGIDDGRNLQEPVDGVVLLNTKFEHVKMESRRQKWKDKAGKVHTVVNERPVGPVRVKIVGRQAPMPDSPPVDVDQWGGGLKMMKEGCPRYKTVWNAKYVEELPGGKKIYGRWENQRVTSEQTPIEKFTVNQLETYRQKCLEFLRATVQVGDGSSESPVTNADGTTSSYFNFPPNLLRNTILANLRSQREFIRNQRLGLNARPADTTRDVEVKKQKNRRRKAAQSEPAGGGVAQFGNTSGEAPPPGAFITGTEAQYTTTQDPFHRDGLPSSKVYVVPTPNPEDRPDDLRGATYSPSPGPYQDGKSNNPYQPFKAGGESPSSPEGQAVAIDPYWQSGMGLPPASLSGTDQQYFGVQFGPSESMPAKPMKRHKLLFLRPFDESLVQVVRYEWNIFNPRFGLPTMYRITLNDPRDMHSGVGLPMATVYVHWSRVIHYADSRLVSDIFGIQRMRQCLNNLLDLKKIYGASGEGFWRGAFLKIFFSTHPQLGGDVIVDDDQLRDMTEQMFNGSQQWGRLSGMNPVPIAPQVVDPTPHINVQIEAICIKLGIPVRVFKGSERGELASSQDDASWNDRRRHRQYFRLTPGLICPFINRLISLGILSEPEGYSVEWPDLDATTDMDKARVLVTRTQAMAQAVQSGMLNSFMQPKDYMTREMKFSEEEADEMLKATADATEQQEKDAQDQADEHGFTPTPPQGYRDDPSQNDEGGYNGGSDSSSSEGSDSEPEDDEDESEDDED